MSSPEFGASRRRRLGFGSLVVAKEEMVEEDRDRELGEIVARAQPRAEPERQERPGPRRRALRIKEK